MKDGCIMGWQRCRQSLVLDFICPGIDSGSAVYILFLLLLLPAPCHEQAGASCWLAGVLFMLMGCSFTKCTSHCVLTVPKLSLLSFLKRHEAETQRDLPVRMRS